MSGRSREKELDNVRPCDILSPEECVDRSAEFYRHVIDELPVSYVLGRVVGGEDHSALDIEILEANPRFSEFAGRKGEDWTRLSRRPKKQGPPLAERPLPTL